MAENPSNIQSVATVAALKAKGPASAQYPYLWLAGYNAPGDGGDSIVWWNPTSVQTADDVFVFAATGVSTGRWVRQFEGLPNVKFAGVKGDGVVDGSNYITAGTDDTVALNKAIQAAIANGFRTLFVPAGNYILSDEVPLDSGAQTFEGIFLQGEQKNLTNYYFKAADTTSKLFVENGGSGGVSNKGMNNFSIFPYSGVYVGQGLGVWIDGQCFSLFENFVIQGLAGGITLSNFSTGSFTEFNRFIGFRLNGNTKNLAFERTAGGENSFHGNVFIGEVNNVTNGYGIYGVGVDVSTKLLIYGCTFEISMFGSGGASHGFFLDKANATGNFGFLEVELALTLEVTASASWFLNGPLEDTGNVVSRTIAAGGMILFSPDNGVWTPVLAFGGASVGVTYAANGQLGTWTFIGQTLTYFGELVLTNKGSSTGSATMKGLPFISTTPRPLAFGNMIPDHVTLDSGYSQFTQFVETNDTELSLSEVGSNKALASLTDVNFANASIVWVSGSYRVAL